MRVMAWVFEHSPVAHRGDLLALLVLADHARDDGTGAYPSVATIAKKARLTPRGAQLALRRLERDGAIKACGFGPHGTIEYRVLTEAADAHTPAVTSGDEVASGAKSVTQGGEVTAPGGANSPSPEPPKNHPSTTRDNVRAVFDEWVRATERDSTRTKLTPKRKRVIEHALKSHGLNDCLKAVRNIGRDAWARGDNDRATRFDELEHALGTNASNDSTRIERWRDHQPRNNRTAPGQRPNPTAAEIQAARERMRRGNLTEDQWKARVLGDTAPHTSDDEEEAA